MIATLPDFSNKLHSLILCSTTLATANQEFEEKKNAGDFLKSVHLKVHYAPCFVIPRGLSTLYRCSLTTVAQSKPYHVKTFNQGLLQS